MDINKQLLFPSEVLKTILSSNIPSAGGVSTGPYGTIIHLEDSASIAVQLLAQAILDNWDALTVLSTSTELTEGDTDPVITVASGIGATEELGYAVLLDGEEYDTGDVTAVAGTVTLNLVSPDTGVYEVYVYRKTDNYYSGHVTITVNEA
jgi:hypothetical protein